MKQNYTDIFQHSNFENTKPHFKALFAFFKIAVLTIVPVFSHGSADAQTVFFNSQAFLIQPIIEPHFSYCAVDMNGDFLDDIVRVSESGIYIDYQNLNGTFEPIILPMDIQATPDWSICAGDINNNGYNDLLFGNTMAVSVVMESDNGTAYTENIVYASIFSQRSTMFDIDNDGWLDAFVCHDGAQSLPLRNDGTGVLNPDFTLLPTANLPGNYSAIWTDYDNDGDGDLYISKCHPFAPPGNINRTNLLYRNNGDGTFS